MSKLFDKPMKAKLIEGIEHQGIGGKVIIIERELNLKEVLSMETIAAFNFWNRRQDLIEDRPISDYTCYYGHVGNLGYFVAEDEIVDGKIEEVDWNEASKYLK